MEPLDLPTDLASSGISTKEDDTLHPLQADLGNPHQIHFLENSEPGGNHGLLQTLLCSLLLC